MNILGLVAAVMIILAIGSGFMMEKNSSLQKLEKNHSGYMTAARSLHNDFEKKCYKKLPKKRAPKKESSPSTPKEKKAREKKAPSLQEMPDCAQLNLFSIPANSSLETLLETTLHYFYEEPLFSSYSSDKKISQELTKELTRLVKDHIEKASLSSEKKESFHLAKLQLKNPFFQSLFYKMLKGSPNFSWEKEEGFPPLIDLLKYAPHSKGKICLFHAPKELLISLFNENIAQKILEEREENPSFDEKQLEEILAQEHFVYKDLSLFSVKKHRPSSKMTITGEDPKTKITLKRNVSFP